MRCLQGRCRSLRHNEHPWCLWCRRANPEGASAAEASWKRARTPPSNTFEYESDWIVGVDEHPLYDTLDEKTDYGEINGWDD